MNVVDVERLCKIGVFNAIENISSFFNQLFGLEHPLNGAV